MNPFMMPSSELSNAWYEFRESISNLDEQAQLTKVAEFWCQCPFSNWSLDPNKPDTWISIWEMMNEGEYCRNAIAIGMETTLRSIGYDHARISLDMTKTQDDGFKFVVNIDDEYLLNYSHGEVIPRSSIAEGNPLYSVSWNGRKYVMRNNN